MFDSHCHLDDVAFDADRDAVLVRAATRGVTDLVIPAVGEASWGRILALRSSVHTQVRPVCHVALGVHPVALPEMAPTEDDAVLARLSALLLGGGAVAVGECGLDATVDLVRAPWTRQEQVLCAQLVVAKALALPVILHARGGEAYARLLTCLERVGLSPAGGVLHSYGGGAHLVASFVEHGLYLGFAGPATYPNARKVHASVRAVPSDRLLAETDAPDQTPAPHRPGRSEPAYVADVIAGLAAVRETSWEDMAVVTTANAQRLFRVNAATHTR